MAEAWLCSGVDPDAPDGDTLTVDVVDGGAARLPRVTATVDPAEYARAAEVTVVWEASAGTPGEQVIADLRDQADLPLLLAPGP